MKYVCDVCGWEPMRRRAIQKWYCTWYSGEDIPEDFECPLCSCWKRTSSQKRSYYDRIITMKEELSIDIIDLQEPVLMLWTV